jgi:hypothetical protein
MLFSETIVVYFENHTRHKLWGGDAEFLSVTSDGTYTYHRAFNG